MEPFLDSTDAVGDGPELARRMDRDGYLFVRGLLPADRLQALRLAFLEIARDAGWIDRSRPLADGVADLAGFCVEPEPGYMDGIRKMHALESYHALQHAPELTGLLQRLWGQTVLPHPRLITRSIFPQREAFTTPPHQDFIPIQGTPETFTAWFPLHDLPAEMGGLEIAEGSHRAGLYEFRPGLGAGGIEIVQSFDGQWRGNPFRQGDVLFFHSMAVHRGVPNAGDRLRQSVDARFQKVTQPVAPGTLLPFTNPQPWDEVYAGWPADSPYRYYWKKWDVKVVDYDFSYHRKRDDMALEMAAQGDPRSRSTLQRIVARDADPAKRRRAQALLAALDARAPAR